MEIPLDQPKTDDIYNYGFDKSLNRDLNLQSSPTVYDTISEALNAGSVLSGGNLNLKTLTIGGLTRMVAPGDDIQAAIDAVNREGGGIVQLLAATYDLRQDINLKAKVSLVGAGREVTILDFNSRAYSVKIEGTSTSTLTNASISDLTIRESGNDPSLNILHSSDVRIENVLVSNGAGVGIRVTRSSKIFMLRTQSFASTTDGFSIDAIGGTTEYSQNTLISCLANNNGGIGFSFNAGTDDLVETTFFACLAKDNTGDGFDFDATSVSQVYSSVVSCASISNGGIGFDVNVNVEKLVLSGNSTSFNSGGNYDVADSANQLFGNQDARLKDNRKVLLMQNTSGGTLRIGNVVVLDSAAADSAITTTTTNGDPKVCGMILTLLAGSNVKYDVLTHGYTTNLYVNNSASSIVVGDFLSTYSHAYYAKKAIAGEVAFAIAISTPTTSTATINALLI